MIIITGATGWLGKTAVKYLLEKFDYSKFIKNVMLFSSVDGYLNINNNRIKVYNFKILKSIALEKKITHIFHTSFLTKEKTYLYGIEEYKKINLNIINTIEEVLNLNPNARIVFFSSGAALPFIERVGYQSDDLYGELKALEEMKLSKNNERLILRVFSLTGYYIRSPEVFALAEFIYSALDKKIITIRSEGIVKRSYGSAEEIVELSWKWLFSDNKGYSVNAVSDTLDLLELANIIKSILGNIEVRHKINFQIISSDYSADSLIFNKKLKVADIKKTSIKEKIQHTILGIKANESKFKI